MEEDFYFLWKSGQEIFYQDLKSGNSWGNSDMERLNDRESKKNCSRFKYKFNSKKILPR